MLPAIIAVLTPFPLGLVLLWSPIELALFNQDLRSPSDQYYPTYYSYLFVITIFSLEPVSPVIHKASSKLVLNTIKSTSSLIGESIEMLTGSSLLLICNATGHPRPKIKWTKSGLPLVSRDRYVINGMALRIFGVRPTDSSEIACTATNIVGEAVETSELLVKGRIVTLSSLKEFVYPSYTYRYQ